MLTVVTPAESSALTTLEAVKAELSLSGTGDDAWLTDTIARAGATIERWCGRVFALETVQETFRIDRATDLLVLSRWPVAAVVNVVAGGVGLDADGWELDADNGDLYRLGTADQRKLWPIGKTVVAYSAGFILPGAEGRNLPADIEAACIALCVRAFHAKGRDPALRSYENPDVESYSFVDPDKLLTVDGLPADVAERLRPFRQVVIG